MSMPIFDIRDDGEFRIVLFEIPNQVTTIPEFVQALEGIRSKLHSPSVLLISGRGPIWAYGMLQLAVSSAPVIAIFDPRFPGYVVTRSSNARYQLGQVVDQPFHKIIQSEEG